MPGSATPLSDSIAHLIASNTRDAFEDFLSVFLKSRLGIIVTRGLHEQPGSHIAGGDEMSMAMSATPDGKRSVLACADRAVFVRTFNSAFNAEMDAGALLNTALANPACEGITVNSATSAHRVVIPRNRFVELLNQMRTQP